jgi:hypothetical protein
MKNTSFLILTILVSLKIFGQEVTEIDIYSTYLDDIKVLKVFLPKDYKKTKKNYPLTLVIDSETLFDSYVASAKLFAKNKTTPQQIIVGITHFSNTDKTKDYGYNMLNSYPDENSMNTLNFIKEELIPKIKKNYRIAKFKTVVSNSLTANFSNYFIFDQKPLFNGYIFINPDLAPGMPEHMKKYVSEIKGDDMYYYLAHGKTIDQKKLELIEETNINLMNSSNIYFNYKFENFKEASNLVTIPQALASSQDYIFSMYSPIDDQEFEKNISYLSTLAAMEYLQYKYENIEYLFGEKIKIRLKDFIRLEPIVIDREEGNHLLEYGELALKTHPYSPLGNYYIGQFYEQSKEYPLSILAYKRGYSKIPANSPESLQYYQHIKRIIALQKLEKENAEEEARIAILEEESDEEVLGQESNIQ